MSDEIDTYWIMAPHQLAEMASPRRQDIVDRLAATGPLSIKELAGQIGARPSALYHHVEKLLEAELIVEAGWRTVRRKREQLYAARAKRMRLLRALADGKQQPVMDTIVASLTRQMERDFRAGGTSPARQTEGPERNYGFFRLIGQPGAADLARINACLQDVAEILWDRRDESAPIVCFEWIMAPLPPAHG
ncbi:MAG: helix-turn-helix domain-containing protein [Allosphingosinicella sp.]